MEFFGAARRGVDRTVIDASSLVVFQSNLAERHRSRRLVERRRLVSIGGSDLQFSRRQFQPGTAEKVLFSIQGESTQVEQTLQ